MRLQGQGDMGLHIILGVNAHVIHVDLEPFFCNHICAYMVHERLEDGGSFGKSKEHDCWFIESQWSDEGCFPLVFLP